MVKHNLNKRNKNKKCSYNNCKNESIGFFVGSNFGLCLCKKHKMGKLKKKISIKL